ncbi:MAG: class II aldolase/adducin family protein, partial [Deferrisomatales bacterium]|nr:class II aldolase/adducin family protein [Deferrisomatales bacterium]
MPMMMDLDTHEGLPKTREEAVAQLVLANRILSNEGVVDAFGHVSVRHPEHPDRFLQSRSCSPEMVTGADILEFDLDANLLTQTTHKPYAERVIHSAVLKARPDVNAVFHGHPHAVIPFSCTGVALRPIVHLGCMFYGGVPVYDDYDVSSGMLIASPEE